MVAKNTPGNANTVWSRSTDGKIVCRREHTGVDLILAE
jgi:hypothetical protein